LVNETLIQSDSNIILEKQEANEVKDLKNKIDYLLKKFENFETNKTGFQKINKPKRSDTKEKNKVSSLLF